MKPHNESKGSFVPPSNALPPPPPVMRNIVGLDSPLSFLNNINSFKLLKEGWYNGEGEGFSAEFIDAQVAEIKAAAEKHFLPSCYKYGPAAVPSYEGGVILEWSNHENGNFLNLERNPDDMRIEVVGSLSVHEFEFTLTNWDHTFQMAKSWLLDF